MGKSAKETVNFEQFSSDSNVNVGSYAGFNFDSVYSLGSGVISSIGWCDTGYNNAIKGHCEAFTSPFSDEYGTFESANLKDSFTLKSMDAASAWCGTQDFTFITYTYKHGALTEKASVNIDVSQTGTEIKFSKYKSDFKNIAAVRIDSNHGNSAGSSCSYGGATYGYQMAFDNMKVQFKKGIPVHQSGQHTLLPIQEMHRAHAQQLAMAHTVHGVTHSAALNHDSHSSPGHHTDGGYHTELLSLGHDGGLTGQFHLPAVEHFGA